MDNLETQPTLATGYRTKTNKTKNTKKVSNMDPTKNGVNADAREG